MLVVELWFAGGGLLSHVFSERVRVLSRLLVAAALLQALALREAIGALPWLLKHPIIAIPSVLVATVPRGGIVGRERLVLGHLVYLLRHCV